MSFVGGRIWKAMFIPDISREVFFSCVFYGEGWTVGRRDSMASMARQRALPEGTLGVKKISEQ